MVLLMLGINKLIVKFLIIVGLGSLVKKFEKRIFNMKRPYIKKNRDKAIISRGVNFMDIINAPGCIAEGRDTTTILKICRLKDIHISVASNWIFLILNMNQL
ncbi:hypothetical protein BCD_1428 (plasmid) [Borrelia crocidurae DOU]|uniref:Uncharacterized protein n=1 Tax=Borrelia crocidurae DOU TaxID=1293575 RepID=W5SK35_9SPIR|nr:hypothetical protein BCD_1428 [Borrelia crocidurae DOU]